MRKLVTAAVCAWLGGAAAPDGGLGVHVDFREPRFGGATQLLRHKPGNPSKTFGANLTACAALSPPVCVRGLDAAAVADARAALGAHAIRARDAPCDEGVQLAVVEHPLAWSGGDAAAIARWNAFAGGLVGDGARRAKRGGASAALVARAEDLWHRPRTVAAKIRRPSSVMSLCLRLSTSRPVHCGSQVHSTRSCASSQPSPSKKSLVGSSRKRHAASTSSLSHVHSAKAPVRHYDSWRQSAFATGGESSPRGMPRTVSLPALPHSKAPPASIKGMPVAT